MIDCEECGEEIGTKEEIMEEMVEAHKVERNKTVEILCEGCYHEQPLGSLQEDYEAEEGKTRTFKITDIWYDTYDEEYELWGGQEFIDKHGYKQTSEQPDPSEMTITLDEDDLDLSGFGELSKEDENQIIEDMLLDRVSDESGFMVYHWNYDEIFPESKSAESFGKYRGRSYYDEHRVIGDNEKCDFTEHNWIVPKEPFMEGHTNLSIELVCKNCGVRMYGLFDKKGAGKTIQYGLDGGDYRAAEGLEFTDWANQETKHHGKTSLKDWADHEIKTHGGKMSFQDWAKHEDKSHIDRFGAEEFAAQIGKHYLGMTCKGGCGGTLQYAEAYEPYWTRCERCGGIYHNSCSLGEEEEWVDGLITCRECFEKMEDFDAEETLDTLIVLRQKAAKEEGLENWKNDSNTGMLSGEIQERIWKHKDFGAETAEVCPHCKKELVDGVELHETFFCPSCDGKIYSSYINNVPAYEIFGAEEYDHVATMRKLVAWLKENDLEPSDIKGFTPDGHVILKPITQRANYKPDVMFRAELKKDSCCCGATKSKPCACMILGIMECNATCPCALEKERNWGGDSQGQLATALRNARIKAQEPKKPLKIEKLDAETSGQWEIGEQLDEAQMNAETFEGIPKSVSDLDSLEDVRADKYEMEVNFENEGIVIVSGDELKAIIDDGWDLDSVRSFADEGMSLLFTRNPTFAFNTEWERSWLIKSYPHTITKEQHDEIIKLLDEHDPNANIFYVRYGDTMRIITPHGPLKASFLPTFSAEDNDCPFCSGKIDFEEAYIELPRSLCDGCYDAVMEKRYDHAYSAESDQFPSIHYGDHDSDAQEKYQEMLDEWDGDNDPPSFEEWVKQENEYDRKLQEYQDSAEYAEELAREQEEEYAIMQDYYNAPTKGIDTFTQPFEEASLDSGGMKKWIVGWGIALIVAVGIKNWK